MNNAVPQLASWPPATRLRRLLAVYVDYLVFSASLTLAVWAFSRIVPALGAVPPLTKFLGFLLLEALLLRLVKWSPGHELLGIRLRLSDEFLASRQESLLSGTLLVDPRLLRSEAWWTMLFGMVAILNGAKTAVRWTMFTPPALVFGVQLSAEASAAFYVLSGTLECLVGAAALQMRWYVLPLSVTCYGLTSLSDYLSRDLWPAWVEAYVHARRAYQGVPVRPGEVESMQAVVPWLSIIPLVLLVWASAVFLRIRARRGGAA